MLRSQYKHINGLSHFPNTKTIVLMERQQQDCAPRGGK